MQKQHRKKTQQERYSNNIINTVTVQKHAVTVQTEKPAGATKNQHYKHSSNTEACTVTACEESQQERYRNGIINTVTVQKHAVTAHKEKPAGTTQTKQQYK